MASQPAVLVNGIPASPSDSNTTSPAQEGRKGFLQNAIQSRFATKHLWDFYHDKSSTTAEYAERLTLYNDKPIDNWMTFMQYYNNYPFQKLRMKDAAHFFKHTVKPVWEDARNQDGGAWYFKIPDEDRKAFEAKEEQEGLALQFFQQVLLMAVNQQFDDVIQPRDDLCGISISKRWKGSTIVIWTRRADEEKTIQAIKDIVLSQVSDSVKRILEDAKNCYYKAHREHTEFDDALAERLLAEYVAKRK